MIPRYQRILFWILVGCVGIMLLFLLRGCEQAHQRRVGNGDETPMTSAAPSVMQTVTFLLANDADGSITPTEKQVVLPDEPSLHAKLLLQALMAQYAQAGSDHPLPGGQAVDDLFLLAAPPDAFLGRTGGQVAVVNLHGAFVDRHPSGVLVEAMTLESIVGTIHAGLPQVEQVQFLVDGKARETLAGHASLLRAYPAVETGSKPLVSLPVGK